MNTPHDMALMTGSRLLLTLILVALYGFAGMMGILLVAVSIGSFFKPNVLSAEDLALLLALAVFLGLMVAFVHVLRKIVMSVASNDPFSEANAQRLTTLAWLATSIWVGDLGFLLYETLLLNDPANVPAADFAGDLAGMALKLLAPLTLFILARVFRHGAAMRDDLEGTV